MISILVNTNYLFNLHNNYYNEFQTTKIIQIIEIVSILYENLWEKF